MGGNAAPSSRFSEQIGSGEFDAFNACGSVDGHLKHGMAFCRIDEVGIGSIQRTSDHGHSIAWSVFDVCTVRARSSRSICYATVIYGSVRVVEHSFTCPFCGEEISMVLDLSVHRHSYVEDCEVCCNPLEISYTVEDDVLAEFEAKCLE